MVATNQAIPLKKQTSPKGVYGIEISGGVYDEEYLGALKGTDWAKEADKMRVMDSIIKMVLGAVLNPIRGATWDVNAADATDANKVMHRDFVEFILFSDMLRPWSVFLNEILGFLPFGHSVFEIIHKNVTGNPAFGNYTGIKTLAWRSQKTLEEWILDQKTGELKGILQRATGDFSNDVTIPAEYLLVFTLDLEGNDFSSTTKAWLRPVYGNFSLKQFLKKLKAIGHEKMTIGTPVGKVPNDAKEEDERVFEQMLSRFTSNQNQYLKIPEGYEVDVLKGGFDASGLEEAIRAENQEIVMGFLANFLNLGQGQSGGAYALGQDLSDFFLKGIQYIADLICDTLNTRLIPHIIDINFGEQDAYPELVCSGIQDIGKEFSEIITNHVNAGAIKVDNTLRSFIRKVHKLPPEDEPEEMEEEVPEEETPPPFEPIQPVEPTPPPPVTGEGAAGPSPTESPGPTQETSDSFHVKQLAQSGRSLIESGGKYLKEIMALHLDFISNKLVADIINRYKNLPEGSSKQRATWKIKAGGVNAYKKDLRQALTNIAAVTTNNAREVIGVRPIRFQGEDQFKEIQASFNRLPKPSRDKVQMLTEDITSAQSADLEKQSKFAFNNSVGTTEDWKVIEKDMKEALNEQMTKTLSAGPVTTASELVNNVNLTVYLGEEAKAQGVVAFEFYNYDPVTEICNHLNGRVFAVDDQEQYRHMPPLHWNCKSVLRPVFEGSRKKLSPNGLQITGNQARQREIKASIQLTDTQITKQLQDLELKMDIQSFAFDRKYFSRSEAIRWVSTRGYSSVDVEEVGEKIIIRQRPLEDFLDNSLRKIEFSQGVYVIAGERSITLPIIPEAPAEFQETTTIQTLIFDKDIFDRNEALNWAREHDFRSDKVDETGTSYRLRQRDPGEFIEGSFRTIQLRQGIKAVIGRLKEQ